MKLVKFFLTEFRGISNFSEKNQQNKASQIFQFLLSVKFQIPFFFFFFFFFFATFDPTSVYTFFPHPWANIIKLFASLLMNGLTKLNCFHPSLMFVGKTPIRVADLGHYPHSKTFALPGTNTLAYLAHSQVTKKKCFETFPTNQSIKLFKFLGSKLV